VGSARKNLTQREKMLVGNLTPCGVPLVQCRVSPRRRKNFVGWVKGEKVRFVMNQPVFPRNPPKKSHAEAQREKILVGNTPCVVSLWKNRIDDSLH